MMAGIFYNLLLLSKTGDIPARKMLLLNSFIVGLCHVTPLVTVTRKMMVVVGTVRLKVLPRMSLVWVPMVEKQLALGVTRMTNDQVQHTVLEALDELTYSFISSG